MQNMVVGLVTFLSKNQPASLHMLQSELVTVQIRIQQPFHIKEISLSNSI